MNRKNYKVKFANSIILIVIPILLIVYVLGLVLALNEEKDKVTLIIGISISVVCILLITYVALLVIGNILFKKHNFEQNEKYFKQDAMLLSKTNLARLKTSKFIFLYLIEFYPRRKEGNRYNKLMYYFYDIDELANFIFENDLIKYLDESEKMGFLYYERKPIIRDEVKRILLPYLKTCQCCGNKTLISQTSEVCPVCMWENDDIVIFSKETISELNKMTLQEAQDNYHIYKAIRPEFKEYARDPYEYEIEE